MKRFHSLRSEFHSLRSEFHSILTPVEWKFTTQRVKSRPVHSIFTPKEVITDVTTKGVKIEWIEWVFFIYFYREYRVFSGNLPETIKSKDTPPPLFPRKWEHALDPLVHSNRGGDSMLHKYCIEINPICARLHGVESTLVYWVSWLVTIIEWNLSDILYKTFYNLWSRTVIRRKCSSNMVCLDFCL